MADVHTSLAWDDYDTKLRAYLCVQTGEDAWLARAWDAACYAADQYLNNAFVDDDEVDETIPLGVVQGCMEWVRLLREEYASGSIVGTGGVKTGDLAVTRPFVDGQAPIERITMAVKHYWSPHRSKVWY